MDGRSGVILVVGGAGYVGSVLVSELLERGYAVRVFDRLYYGDQGLAPVRDRIELAVGDMRQMDPAVLLPNPKPALIELERQGRIAKHTP